jgi:hypothetical protein
MYGNGRQYMANRLCDKRKLFSGSSHPNDFNSFRDVVVHGERLTMRERRLSL